MVFSSLTFLSYFLPLTLLVYYASPKMFRNTALLAASFVFYTWGTGSLALLLGVSIACNYLLGRSVSHLTANGHKRQAALALIAALLINFLLLGLFKYAGFVVSQLDIALSALGWSQIPVPDLLLPLGISFYTFHAVSYIVDVYRGTSPALANPIDFALYITFFPQLVAGPIVRFHEIRDQLVERHENLSQFTRGVVRFGHGLAKKVIIADTVAPFVNATFATPTDMLSGLDAWLGVIAYAVQLYFDFSGYTDMALGLGGMVGFRLPENFDRPYASHTITEFWRRWHMSLSRWFRDYLYIPLGGNRVGPWRTYGNLVFVFLVVGLWHGANWTFVLWGAYHGTWLLVERALGMRDGPAGWLRRGRTLLLVLLGWVLFRAADLPSALGYYGALIRPSLEIHSDLMVHLTPIATLALAIGVLTMMLPSSWVTGYKVQEDGSPAVSVVRVAIAVTALPLALLFVMAGTPSPFLYFRF